MSPLLPQLRRNCGRRKAEVRELIEKFKKHRLIAIVADSGAGKSSLAQAGFVPAFRGGALADPSREEPDDKIWHVVVMRPGSEPVQGLKDGLTDAAKLLGLDGGEQAKLRGRINISDPGESAFALRCDLDRKNTETLLIIDQFEELLIQTPEEKRAPRRGELGGAARRMAQRDEFDPEKPKAHRTLIERGRRALVCSDLISDRDTDYDSKSA